MKLLAPLVAVLACACGDVILERELGETCMVGTDCLTGTCVDGVCCDRACDSTCEACTAAKTGGTDGTCSAVASNTDPDTECRDEGAETCGSRGGGCNGSATAPACQVYSSGTSCETSCTDGTASVGTCDGSGTCAVATSSCGYFACDAGGTLCRTACAGTNECSATGFCNATGVCAKRLRIALDAGATSCLRTESFPPLVTALTARGHTPTIVTGDMIDSAAELAGFDVVLLGGPGGACTEPGWNTYATAVRAWVEAGGGYVATGWTPYMTSGSGANRLPDDIAAILPVSGSAYLNGAQQVTVVGTHPIINGLGTFAINATYLPFGGTAQPTSTQLLRDGANNNLGQAWDVSQGRVVYLGPLYVDSFASYANQSLTDGTNVPALEMLIRALEWSGKSL